MELAVSVNMKIRIDCHFNGQKKVISIAGRLTETAVGQLQEAFDQIESSLVVDLSNLVYADNEGIDILRAIIDKGAQVIGASPFIALLLGGAPE